MRRAVSATASRARSPTTTRAPASPDEDHLSPEVQQRRDARYLHVGFRPAAIIAPPLAPAEDGIGAPFAIDWTVGRSVPTGRRA
jgi:hypothetical protein